MNSVLLKFCFYLKGLFLYIFHSFSRDISALCFREICVNGFWNLASCLTYCQNVIKVFIKNEISCRLHRQNWIAHVQNAMSFFLQTPRATQRSSRNPLCLLADTKKSLEKIPPHRRQTFIVLSLNQLVLKVSRVVLHETRHVSKRPGGAMCTALPPSVWGDDVVQFTLGARCKHVHAIYESAQMAAVRRWQNSDGESRGGGVVYRKWFIACIFHFNQGVGLWNWRQDNCEM